MKLGIALLAMGITLLIISIPFSISGIIIGVNQLTQSDLSGGFIAYCGILGIVTGLVMTAIGAIRVFKQ
ncbi:hypothetical protein ACFLTP_02310 [Chloroflexota bacterium]